MPLKPALGVTETVAGYRLGGPGGGVAPPLPMHPWHRGRGERLGGQKDPKDKHRGQGEEGGGAGHGEGRGAWAEGTKADSAAITPTLDDAGPDLLLRAATLLKAAQVPRRLRPRPPRVA